MFETEPKIGSSGRSRGGQSVCSRRQFCCKRLITGPGDIISALMRSVRERFPNLRINALVMSTRLVLKHLQQNCRDQRIFRRLPVARLNRINQRDEGKDTKHTWIRRITGRGMKGLWWTDVECRIDGKNSTANRCGNDKRDALSRCL